MNDKENIMQGSTKYIALILALMLGGCASTTTPKMDDHFGEAVNAAKAQQTINPDASSDTDPVAGLDGKSAKGTMDRYEKSFEKPRVTGNVFTIGVGGGGASSTNQ